MCNTEVMFEQAQPIVIIRRTPKHLVDGYLVCEKLLLNVADIPIALFMQYCAGCRKYHTCMHVNCILKRLQPYKCMHAHTASVVIGVGLWYTSNTTVTSKHFISNTAVTLKFFE